MNKSCTYSKHYTLHFKTNSMRVDRIYCSLPSIFHINSNKWISLRMLTQLIKEMKWWNRLNSPHFWEMGGIIAVNNTKINQQSFNIFPQTSLITYYGGCQLKRHWIAKVFLKTNFNGEIPPKLNSVLYSQVTRYELKESDY